MKFAAIADWAERDGFPVKYMCEQLGVSVSGYYAWRGRPMSERAEVDAKLTALIEGIFSDKDGNVGRRRMVAELAARGHRVSIKRVHRLMSAAGLRGRHPRPWRKTTIAGHNTVPAPDLIGRDFTAAGPNQRWVGDITYVKTLDGWAYVATVIDLYSRMVVGWSVADHMRTDLVIEALEMAIKQRRPKKHVIFHSDRGTQYTSEQFAKYCKKNKIRRSLGRTGICYDNAVAESFFATYKKELIHTQPWKGVTHLARSTFNWIATYYNRKRRHSPLHYLTPAEWEIGLRSVHEVYELTA